MFFSAPHSHPSMAVSSAARRRAKSTSIIKGAIAAVTKFLSNFLLSGLDIFLLLRYVTFPVGQLR